MGALLIDRDAIYKIVDTLEPDDFFGPGNRRVYTALTALLERQEQIDSLTARLELSRRNELDQIGGIAYLTALASTVSTAMEIERDAHMVGARDALVAMVDAEDDSEGCGG